ncbi:MAG: response regulator [Fimbriimonadales bacterium]
MHDLCILVVEDERLLDRVVTDALRMLGFACDVARSEEEAMIRLQQRRYPLIILDLRLQGGSGLTVLKQVRRLDPSMPVVLVTAYSLTEEVQTALEWGVDALLYKPFDIETLLATVRALLRRERQPTLTHAVVQMASPASPLTPKRMNGLEPGTLALLRRNAFSLACCVHEMDEHWLSVETEPIPRPENPRWLLEWTGSDALYQFNTRVVDSVLRENAAIWLLRQPTLIRRIQRRRYPRVAVQGRAFVSQAGRLQRATEARLVDLSEAGACVILTEPPHRGDQVHLDVQAETERGALSFQREGVVCSIVAFVEEGHPRYRVGVQLERLPAAVRRSLRQLRIARLTR